MPTYSSEIVFSQLLKDLKKIKEITISKEQIKEVAKTSALLRQRWKTAHKYNDVVTNQHAADFILGLDFVINSKGWVYGIDVTTDWESLENKQSKLLTLKAELKELGIDGVFVVLIEQQEGWVLLEAKKKEEIKERFLSVLKTKANSESEFVSEFVM